jgi:hypothetical protein
MHKRESDEQQAARETALREEAKAAFIDKARKEARERIKAEIDGGDPTGPSHSAHGAAAAEAAGAEAAGRQFDAALSKASHRELLAPGGERGEGEGVTLTQEEAARLKSEREEHRAAHQVPLLLLEYPFTYLPF